MSQVKDLATGEISNVEDSQLPEIVKSQNVAIPSGEYDFETPLGERVRVPAEQFREAIDSGYKYVDESVKKEERLQKEYGDSPGRTFAEGIGRSLTLGLSDKALIALGADQEGMRERQERNPIAAGTGEAVGLIAPILLSGGGAGIAKGAGAAILEKTAAGQAAKLAATVGKGAGSLVKNEIAKGALKLGAEGAIEGAIAGVGKTISEDALGQADFSAEALMANVGTSSLAGASFGAALGAGGAAFSKYSKKALGKFRSEAIDSLNLPEADKIKLKAQEAAMDDLAKINETFENPEIKQAINELGYKAPATEGILSPSTITKNLESSLAQSPSLPGLTVGGKLKAFVNETQEKAASLFEKAKESTPFDLGTKARQNIMGSINERLRPAQDTLKRIYNDLGEAPVRDRGVKLLRTRLQKSDIARLGLDKGIAKRIEDVLPELNTINSVNVFKKGIGKEMSAAYRAGELNQAELLSDIYDTLSRVERLGIEDAALRAGPKTGPKLAKSYLKAFDDSMEAYRSIYKEYTPLAEQLGTKLRRPDDFLDWLESAPAEKIGSRLVDMNDYGTALKMSKDFPELFDVARGRKLADLMKSVSDNTGTISIQKFQTKVSKMTPEQKKILFGFDAAQQKKLNNILTVMKELPKNINPSGTSINQTFLDIINPVFQGKELLRYAVYRGGDKAIKQYLIKSVPVLTEAERQINKTKGSISSAVNGFFKSVSPAIAVGALSVKDDRKIENAKKVYEQIYNDPQSFIDKFLVKNKDLEDAAPNVSAALQQKMLSGMRFLQSKVPSQKTDYAAHDYTPSRSELLGFQEYVEAVEKPLSVLDKMRSGYISPRHIEALKVVYPQLYSALQEDLNAKMPKKISKTQATMLQQLMGVKIRPTADYNLLNSITNPQQPQQAPQQQSSVPVSGAKMLNQSSRAQSGVDKVLYRT